MTFRDQLFEAAKPFLMKEGIESSKEIIANNSTSFDEMGMANANPGEFAPEEITDQENLVNTAKMANDNDFNSEAPEAEVTVVSILGDDAATNAGQALEDLVRLGGEECPECEEEPERNIGDIIESILRKKDNALLESLDEADEMEEMATYYPGFIKDNKFVDDQGRKHDGGPSKAADAFVAWLKRAGDNGSSNIDNIISGSHVVPDDVKAKWPEAISKYRQYSISKDASPKYRDTLINLAKAETKGDPEAAMALLASPTEEFCNKAGAALNRLLHNKIDLQFVPGEDILQTREDKFAQNYQTRKAFENAYASEKDRSIVNRLEDWLNPKEVANPLNLSDEDIALLSKYNITPDDPKAKAFLRVLKPKAKATESVLAESDYAGNLSYNPDKRLNASDVLNAVKNAVKPELAPALSIVKNVDANEEPSYAIQNIDEKDLPASIEIDTNTDEKVVLKKDGNSYKFDK